jgi:predicted Fe-S protein YdhL (DUF1289 family)
MITSPCINICQMDKDSGLCQGCLRTIDEITVWSRLDDPARIRILADVAQRRLAHVPNQGVIQHDTDKQDD